jgi:hypothetical protein
VEGFSAFLSAGGIVIPNIFDGHVIPLVDSVNETGGVDVRTADEGEKYRGHMSSPRSTAYDDSFAAH